MRSWSLRMHYLQVWLDLGAQWHSSCHSFSLHLSISCPHFLLNGLLVVAGSLHSSSLATSIKSTIFNSFIKFPVMTFTGQKYVSPFLNQQLYSDGHSNRLVRVAPEKEGLAYQWQRCYANKNNRCPFTGGQGRWLNLKSWESKTRMGRNEPIFIVGSICISVNFLPDFLPTNYLSSMQASLVGQTRSWHKSRPPRSSWKPEDAVNIMSPAPSHFRTSKQELSCAEYRGAKPIFCFWY